jgi:hypothetical protein
MSGYIKRKLQEYNQVKSKILQTRPDTPAPKRFGSEAQQPLLDDTSPHLNKTGMRRVQQIVGSILYYAHCN